MKSSIYTLTIFLISINSSVSQSNPTCILDKNHWFVGIESGGYGLQTTEHYNDTMLYHFNYISTATRIGYSPLKNLFIGGSVKYSFIKSNYLPNREWWGLGYFARYYLPFTSIHKPFKWYKESPYPKKFEAHFLFEITHTFQNAYLSKDHYIEKSDFNSQEIRLLTGFSIKLWKNLSNEYSIGTAFYRNSPGLKHSPFVTRLGFDYFF